MQLKQMCIGIAQNLTVCTCRDLILRIHGKFRTRHKNRHCQREGLVVVYSCLLLSFLVPMEVNSKSPSTSDPSQPLTRVWVGVRKKEGRETKPRGRTVRPVVPAMRNPLPGAGQEPTRSAGAPGQDWVRPLKTVNRQRRKMRIGERKTYRQMRD